MAAAATWAAKWEARLASVHTHPLTAHTARGSAEAVALQAVRAAVDATRDAAVRLLQGEEGSGRAAADALLVGRQQVAVLAARGCAATGSAVSALAEASRLYTLSAEAVRCAPSAAAAASLARTAAAAFVTK